MLVEPGTFSKSPAAWGLPADIEALAGRKAKIKLSDGHWYLDMTSSLGQNLFAYNLEFLEYMLGKGMYGTSFTLPHAIERVVADKLAAILKKNVPGWKNEQIGVRFGNAGSDVIAAAVRVARAYTGRMPILTFKNHYHGWHDMFIGRTDPAHGCYVDQNIYQAQWGRPIDTYPDDFFAAIIFEHPAEAPNRVWVRFLERYCDKNNTLLIVDEVVTGLRYGLGGISEFYGYKPDLYCMGKALANGFRLSALAGEYEIMKLFTGNSPVFWSSTPNGNALDLFACQWVLDHYNKERCGQLWKLGHMLITGLKDIGYKVFGHPVRFVLEWDDEYKQAVFIKKMYKCKILFNRPVMVNLAMTEQDIERVLIAAKNTYDEISIMNKEQLVDAAGELPRQLFREARR